MLAVASDSCHQLVTGSIRGVLDADAYFAMLSDADGHCLKLLPGPMLVTLLWPDRASPSRRELLSLWRSIVEGDMNDRLKSTELTDEPRPMKLSVVPLVCIADGMFIAGPGLSRPEAVFGCAGGCRK